MWDTSDGRRHEWITITFYKEAVNHNFQDLAFFTSGLMKN